MENVVHKGAMHCLVIGILQKKVWQARFYVLYGSTRANQSRLDFYENEAAFLKEPNYRKSVYMEDVREIRPRAETIKDRTHLIEIAMTTSKKDVVLSCSSEAEQQMWLRFLREVKQGHHRVSVVSVPGSTSSLGSAGDVTVFDDNDIYEATEDLSAFFDVEAAQTEAAKKCTLQGRYVLSVNQHSLDLRSDSGETLYSWYYKHIRRYGRSSSSFTFEAGRKCSTGAGLFTFLTPQGDLVFSTVQNQTKSLRAGGAKSTEDMRSIGDDDTPPTLPKRNYSASSSSLDAVFEEGSGAGGGKASSPVTKRNIKGPPMLRKIMGVVKPQGSPPKEDYAQVNKPRVPVRTGQYDLAHVPGRAGQYDLARLFPPMPHEEDDDDEHLYTEPYEPSIPGVLPSRLPSGPPPSAALPSIPLSASEPEYAVYDITQSSRYKPLESPTENEYEVPEDVRLDGVPPPQPRSVPPQPRSVPPQPPLQHRTDLSDICENLRHANIGEHNDTRESLKYHSLDMSKARGQASPRKASPRLQRPGHVYAEIGHVTSDNPNPPPEENVAENIYDEVCT